jgi:glyoxylase-like metal-dependent hydrolase (beta-lactamase superfamily II)
MIKIPVWIPIKSLKALNSYYFPEDNSIIDPGMLAGRSILTLLTHLKNVEGDPCGIEKIVVTHFHVDHSTMSVLFSKIANPTFYMGEHDLEVIRGGVEHFINGAVNLFLDNGMPKEEAEKIVENHPAMSLKDVYEQAQDIEWRSLKDGDTIVLGGETHRVMNITKFTFVNCFNSN